jgi:hypothetical protein
MRPHSRSRRSACSHRRLLARKCRNLVIRQHPRQRGCPRKRLLHTGVDRFLDSICEKASRQAQRQFKLLKSWHVTSLAVHGRIPCASDSSPEEIDFTLRQPCPGDLLHMDVSRYARFERPATPSPVIARHVGKVDAFAAAGRLRLRARDRRRPLAPRLRRAPSRRARSDRDQLRRAERSPP